jgi:hypothetical protein
VNRSAADVADVPPGVVTVISTVPLPAGDVAVIDVAELTVKLVALAAPNFTAVAPVRLVPVMVTDVPPAVGPDVGETLVTVGATFRFTVIVKDVSVNCVVKPHSLLGVHALAYQSVIVSIPLP